MVRKKMVSCPTSKSAWVAPAPSRDIMSRRVWALYQARDPNLAGIAGPSRGIVSRGSDIITYLKFISTAIYMLLLENKWLLIPWDFASGLKPVNQPEM